MKNVTRFSYFLVLCLFAWSSSYAQKKTISGKVTELESGKPIPGANIFVKGTTSFGAFLNYTNAEGIYLNSWTKRASAKLVYDASLAKWLSFGANTTITKTWANNVSEAGGGFHASRAITEVPPIFPVKWPDGTWSNSTQISGFTFEGQPNPVHRLLEEDNLANGTRLFGNLFLNFKLTSYLQFRSQVGINNYLSENRYYAPADMITVGFPDGYASISNGKQTYWQNENYFTYSREFGSHRLNGVLGANWSKIRAID